MYTHIYIQIYVYAIITSEKRGHEFEGEQEGDIWEDLEGSGKCTIISAKGHI